MLTNLQVMGVIANMTAQANSMGRYKKLNLTLLLVTFLSMFGLYVHSKCDSMDEFFEIIVSKFKMYFISLIGYVFFLITNFGTNKECLEKTD